MKTQKLIDRTLTEEYMSMNKYMQLLMIGMLLGAVLVFVLKGLSL